MRVIGVIDLKGGRAVHAKRGERAAYEPVAGRLLSPDRVGDAAALACAYRDALAIGEIYVADLDAIADPAGAHQDLAPILATGVRVMVDAGVTTPREAERLLNRGVTRAVVGLETLASLDALAQIVDGVGPERVVFGLDLRDGRPVARPAVMAGWEAESQREGEGEREREGVRRRKGVERLAEQAVQMGVRSVLVVDLGRVGSGVGIDLELVGSLRATCGSSELLVGGGVRGPEDIAALEALGCDGVLLGTALHAGMLVGKRWQGRGD